MATAYIMTLNNRIPNPANPATESILNFQVHYWGLAIGDAEEEVPVVIANSDNKAQQKTKVNNAILARLDLLNGSTHTIQNILTLGDLAG